VESRTRGGLAVRGGRGAQPAPRAARVPRFDPPLSQRPAEPGSGRRARRALDPLPAGRPGGRGGAALPDRIHLRRPSQGRRGSPFPRTNRTRISPPPRTNRTRISPPPRTNRTRSAPTPCEPDARPSPQGDGLAFTEIPLAPLGRPLPLKCEVRSAHRISITPPAPPRSACRPPFPSQVEHLEPGPGEQFVVALRGGSGPPQTLASLPLEGCDEARPAARRPQAAAARSPS